MSRTRQENAVYSTIMTTNDLSDGIKKVSHGSATLQYSLSVDMQALKNLTAQEEFGA